MAFHVEQPDFELSKKTGMTRDHWIEAGRFLLDGVFRHVPDADSPIALPKRPGKTYPQPDDPAWKYRSAEFEGLSRTFMIAAPLIANDPDVKVRDFALRDYYADLIVRSMDPKHPNFVGYITDLAAEYKQPLFQHTCESAALVLGLMMSREQVWDRYTQAQRDQIATVLHDYYRNMTNSHNWRWFNVMLGSWLDGNGYDIDRGPMEDHLQNLMASCAGDGWYRDMSQFDYYSSWAFQFYGPIWCSMYGYENYPEIAAIIERRHNELQRTYGRMFGRNGHSLMWGRSIIYRCAASAPLAVAFRLKNTTIDPGWARRIASGNLLQFLSRDSVFEDGLPTLGFYRTFEPLVQGYSCSASPFWLAKVFLALDLPADNPFWNAPETKGDWDAVGDSFQTDCLRGPGLTITMHGLSRTAEVRPGKVDGRKSNPNYTRLAYNSQFVWEDDNPEGHTAGTYCVQQLGMDLPFMANPNLRFVDMVDDVLYRQIDLPGWLARVDLAEVFVKGGVLRIDRVSIPYPYELHLTHFGVPHLGGNQASILTQTKEGYPVIQAQTDLRNVTMVAYSGWDELTSACHSGLNAECEDSTVIYARRRCEKPYAGMFLAMTLMLHHIEPEPWDDDVLNPVAAWEAIPWSESGQPCGAQIKLKDGRDITVDFDRIMGRISI